MERYKPFLLEYDKSTFNLSIVKHPTGHYFIEIEQIVHFPNDINGKQTLKINPTILDDLMEVLATYSKSIPELIKSSKQYFSAERKEEIKKRYFKGITIEDLAFQFNCSVEIIQQIIRNSGLEVVDNKMPDSLKYFKPKKIGKRIRRRK